MGLLKNSKLYNLLNERAMNRNQETMRVKNMLDDPIDGFMSTDKAKTFLKEKTINKNFKMALTLIDNLAEKMYEKSGREEYAKNQEQIDDIIEYLRFTQKDIYLVNPGPDDSLKKIEQAISRLAQLSGKTASDYPHKYDEVVELARIISKYKTNIAKLDLEQKRSFASQIVKGLTPGTALRNAFKYYASAEDVSVPTLNRQGKYPGDDGFTYYVQNGQWFAYNIKSKKTTNLSEDPKYAQNIKNLNKHFGTDIKVGDSDKYANIDTSKPAAAIANAYPNAAHFADKIVEVAVRLEMNPFILANAMNYETAGKFSASTKNPQSSATGLIQFMDFTAERLGTTITALAAMTEEEQMEYVFDYFKPYKGKVKTQSDVYMVIFYPRAVGKGPDYNIFNDYIKKYTTGKGANYKLSSDGYAWQNVKKYLSADIIKKYNLSAGKPLNPNKDPELGKLLATAIYLKPNGGIATAGDYVKRANKKISDKLPAPGAGGGGGSNISSNIDVQKDKPKEKGPALPYVYIADSQGFSGLGEAIKKRMGPATPGKNFFQKNGATAAAIMSEFGGKIKAAVSNTQNIIFTLGGNGSNRASFLAKDVLENAPESAKITWILAPPAVKPTASTKFVNTPGKSERQVDIYKATRAKYNKEITNGIKTVENKLGMQGRINIIDPYAWFEENVESSLDGVHVDTKAQNPNAPGEKYIASIQSELKPTSQSAVAMKENFVISETNLKRLLSTLLNENIADQFPKNKAEGDKFRNWVNDSYSQTEIADLYDDLKDSKLDRSGSHNNEYVKRAWRVFGNEYVEFRELKRVSGKEKARPDRGIPNEFFKFKRGKDVDKGQEIYALDVAGNIYMKDKKSNKFQKLNEIKIFINESKTKAIIVESNLEMATEFLKDLKAMGLDQDEEIAKASNIAINNIKTAADSAKKKQTASSSKNEASSNWAQHIRRGFTGMQRKDAQRALGDFIPEDVEGESFLDWAIGYWAAKKPTSHGTGLGFDFVPLGGTSYKDINKAIIEFKKHASGMSPWDETGTGKGVSWSNYSPVGSPRNKGAHYHFTISSGFKIKSTGEDLIKSQGMNSKAIDHVIGYGTQHHNHLKPAGKKAFLLFGAILKKFGHKVTCTSSLRTPESQVRIMLQQSASRELAEQGKGINWLLQYGKYGVAFGKALKNGSVQKPLT
jgi:hypothetical protein